MGDHHVVAGSFDVTSTEKLTGSVARSNCTVIFINQIRMKIGVMFGSPETTTGGNALKFYSCPYGHCVLLQSSRGRGCWQQG